MKYYHKEDNVYYHLVMTNTNTKTITKTNTFRELHQRAILDPCDLWDISSELWGDMTWPKKYNDNDKYKYKDNYKDNDIDNPRDLSHLRHWSQFWQLRTWFYNNLCCLTIKSNTGQHLQLLQCFFFKWKKKGGVLCIMSMK